MAEEPYCTARRVFWVLDNGSSHRGNASVRRLQEAHPNLVPIHLPLHASWLNQVEIYFSILQRKVLTPADVASLDELGANILAFQAGYDVVISNGVINLCPDKLGVYKEVNRVLKAGGRMAIADICVEKPVPESALHDIDPWTG